MGKLYLQRIAENENGLIRTVSPDGKYVKYKYGEGVIYNQAWTPAALDSRGHVYRLSDGECVLRPWSKFFNAQELFNMETGELSRLGELLNTMDGYQVPAGLFSRKFSATDKLDGSLCIAGIVDGQLLTTSSGSFESPQAKWADAWLREHGVDSVMSPGLTYMFEIIWDEDYHPIRYDYEGCVLTGIIVNDTGREFSYDLLKWFADRCGIRVTERVEFDSFDAAREYVSSLPNTKEGLVLTFDGGFKLKMKGPEFLTLQRLFHSLSESNLAHSFDYRELRFPDSVRHSVQEEFTEVREYMDRFENRYRTGAFRILGFAVFAVSTVESVDCKTFSRAVWEMSAGMLPGQLRGYACECARLLKSGAKMKDMVESVMPKMARTLVSFISEDNNG